MPDPLVVDVAQLRQRKGNTTPFQDQVVLDGLVVGETKVVDDRVRVDLTLEAIIEGVSATGELAVAAVAPCRRCLDEVALELTVDVIEVFETEAAPGDTYPIDRDETIDLGPMVRDAVLLALPQLVLCREDCVGPDPERFPTSDEPSDVVPDGTPATADPRWSALDELDFD